MMSNVRQEIPLLYALKASCAAGVVYLHVWFKNEYIFLFSRLAVPIFFMISGYFLFSSQNVIDNKKVCNSIQKTIFLIIWVNLLYIVYYLTVWLVTGDPIFRIDSIRSLFTWLLSGATFCFPLWYLHAYIQALIAILILVRMIKKKTEPVLMILAILLSAGSILIGKYAFLWNNDLIEINPWYYRNFLFYGIPCIIWGMMIRKCEHQLSNKESLLCWTIALLLFVIEIKCYQRVASFGGNGDLAIMSIPLSITTILVCIKYKDMISMRNILALIGKKYAMQIYVLHILFFMLCLNYWDKPYQHSEMIYSICLLGPIISTWLFNKLKKAFISNEK